MYIIQYKLSTSSRWKWSMKNKYKCNPIICTFWYNIIVPRNHLTLKVEHFEIAVKNRAKLSTDKPSLTDAKAISGILYEVLISIPNKSTVNRVIQNTI